MRQPSPLLILFRNNVRPEFQSFTSVPFYDHIFTSTDTTNPQENESKINNVNLEIHTDNPLKFSQPARNLSRIEKIQPKFIITGVMKCGTGAVSKFLAYHSKLVDTGETYFFNRYYSNGLGSDNFFPIF